MVTDGPSANEKIFLHHKKATDFPAYRDEHGVERCTPLAGFGRLAAISAARPEDNVVSCRLRPGLGRPQPELNLPGAGGRREGAVMSVHAILPPRPDVLVAGAVPPRADGFFPRAEPALDLGPGQTAVLVHGDVTYAAPVSQGGTGKTQLAVAFCHALLDRRAVEVLVWVNAARREAVVSGFAQAAGLVDPGLAAGDEGAEVAAARFVSWLHRTRRPWAMVLDDLADPGDLRELWPDGPAGRVLLTTRLPAAALART